MMTSNRTKPTKRSSDSFSFLAVGFNVSLGIFYGNKLESFLIIGDIHVNLSLAILLGRISLS